MTISFWLNGTRIEIPISEGTMEVPPLSEVVRKIVLRDVSSPTLVDSQEICKELFVARQ